MAKSDVVQRAALAVYAGSFDPITNGHVDIIERSLQVFDHVIAAVAHNPHKDGGSFSVAERVALIDEVFAKHTGRVVAESFSGLLIDYVRAKGANVIVRGLRAVADFEYEFQMTMMNRHLAPEIETIFMMAGEAHFYTSSKLVKEVISLGGNVQGLVPEMIQRRLEERLRR